MCQTHETVETPENRINCGTDVRVPKRLPDIVFPNTISTIHVKVITTQYTANEERHDGTWAINSNNSRHILSHKVTALINPLQHVCISKWHQIITDWISVHDGKRNRMLSLAISHDRDIVFHT